MVVVEDVSLLVSSINVKIDVAVVDSVVIGIV